MYSIRGGGQDGGKGAAGAGAGVAGLRVAVTVALDADGAPDVLPVTVVAGSAQLTGRACNTFSF